MFCQQQVAQLRDMETTLDENNARIVVVGSGAPHFIEGFRERAGFDGLVLTDPDLAVFSALELTRGLSATFHPKVFKKAWSAWKQGFRQKKPQGNVWQQGGVFIVNPDGKIRFSYRSKFGGDHPTPSTIANALTR